MAYNYDKRCLVDHKVTVDQLLELGKNGGHARLVYDDPAEARSVRHFLNSLMANMVMFNPEHLKPRSEIRTWIKYEDEKWVLYVGRPEHRIRGGKPMMRGTPTLTQAQTRKGNRLFEMTETRFAETIKDASGWLRFGTAIDGLEPSVEAIRAEFASPISNMEALEVFEGWEPKLLGPTTVLFRRVK